MKEYEFKVGDIIAEIGGSARYVIEELEKWGYIVFARTPNGMGTMRASKSWLEGTCVRVGTWDFEGDREADDAEVD